MRWMWTVLLLLLSTTAHADARLRLTSDRPIVIVVNLVPYTFGNNSVHMVDFKAGKEGRQNVRVLNLVGQEVWRGQVDVPRNMEVRAKWSGRTFEVYDRRPLPTAPGPRLRSNGPSGAQKLDALAASVSSAGPEERSLEDVEALLRHAADGSETQETSTSSGGNGASGPPPAGAPARLALVSRNSSWSNVYVNDELVEFRGTTDPVEVPLPSGEHRVVIKDFQDKQTWWRGRVWVYPELTVELQFSKNAEPRSLNQPEAWHLDPAE